MNIQGFNPAIVSPLQAQSAGATKAASAAGGDSANASSTSASSLQSTFLNLLVTELQNQDPTSPVDPTQMVTQMVSLNQLDQLISINQTLANMSSGSSASGASVQRPETQSKKTAIANETNAFQSNNPALDMTAAYQVPSGYTGNTNSQGLMNLFEDPRFSATPSYPTNTGVR
jgi:flagellar basal-body rod modification protein FlgD